MIKPPLGITERRSACRKNYSADKSAQKYKFLPAFFKRLSLGHTPQGAKSLILTREQEGEGNTYQGVPRKKFDFVQSDNSGVLF